MNFRTAKKIYRGTRKISRAQLFNSYSQHQWGCALFKYWRVMDRRARTERRKQLAEFEAWKAARGTVTIHWSATGVLRVE